MFGHAGISASDPDFLPLSVAFAAFGGHGMKATLMDQVRTRRGLAYGAYMSPEPRRGPGPVRGWVSSGADRAVTTLKLALRLYRQLGREGISAERVRFFREFLAGSYAAEMDAPERRLAARVGAEIEGLPPDAVDTYPERVRAVTVEQVAAAIRRHVHADDLAITLVASADRILDRLVKSGIERGAIDVVRYDSY
jgi:zinc protease